MPIVPLVRSMSRPGRTTPLQTRENGPGDSIHVIQQRTDAVDVPTIAGFTQGFPIKHRVSPKLSLRAEIVRRHTRHKARPELHIQEKQFRICPYVAGIGRDIERDIPNQADAFGLCVFP